MTGITVSQRAHNIRQINPHISWANAMKQAYQDVARQEIEREEAEAKQHIQWLSKHIRTRNAPHTMNMMNQLLADVVEALKENQESKYPWTSAKNKIDPYESSLKDLMYDYTKGEEWDSAWRGSDGRIRMAWLNQIISIAKDLEVDIEKLKHWSDVNAIFN